MKNVHIVKRDGTGKSSPVIWEQDFDLPETLNEWLEYYGSESATCDVLMGAEVIKIRAMNDPRREHKTVEIDGIQMTKSELIAAARELAELKRGAK